MIRGVRQISFPELGMLGSKISDDRNYFFQPNSSTPNDYVRIGYCSLDENEMASTIKIWKQVLSHLLLHDPDTLMVVRIASSRRHLASHDSRN